MPIDTTRLAAHAGAMIEHLPLVVLLAGASVPCAETRLHSAVLANREYDFVSEYATSVMVLTAALPANWAVDKRAVFRAVTYRILQIETSPDAVTTTLHLANPSTARMT